MDNNCDGVIDEDVQMAFFANLMAMAGTDASIEWACEGVRVRQSVETVTTPTQWSIQLRKRFVMV